MDTNPLTTANSEGIVVGWQYCRLFVLRLRQCVNNAIIQPLMTVVVM